MPCERFSRWIGDYYDHRLPKERREIFEAHLVECATCRKTLSDWAEITALTQSILPVKAPEHFEAVIRQKIEERAAGRNGWNTFWNYLIIPKLPLAALAAMVVILISALLLQWGDQPDIRNRPPSPIVSVPEPANGSDYVNVLLKGAGDEQVIIPFPSPLRVESADNDESYFQNVSH